MPINFKIEEANKYEEITKGKGSLYYRKIKVETRIHPAKHVTITDWHEVSTHYIHAYTHGS
jgi:hypothetical protein